MSTVHKTMKTRNQSGLPLGGGGVRCRTISRWLRRTLIALALLGLTSGAQLKAQEPDFVQTLKDFAKTPLTQGGTNNTQAINNGGAEALARVWLARANLKIKTPAAGGGASIGTLY